MGRDGNGRRRANNAPPFTSLPADVTVNILKKLPVKILLRCRCVCREWNSIITGESFINTHLLSQPQGYLLCHFFQFQWAPSSTFKKPHLCPEKTQLCSFFPDASFSLSHKFEVPLPYSSQQEPGRILVGSLDGLLCLTDQKPFGRELYLWNPSIRKCKTLSNYQTFFGLKTKIVFGLGFRVHTSDRIIIRIVVFQSQSTKLKSNRLPQAEIYSFSTESWKKVEVSVDVSRRLMDISVGYVNLHGDLIWMATFSDEEGQVYKSILSFNVNEGKFKEIKLPSDYDENGTTAKFLRIEVYRGSLAVAIFGKSTPEDRNKYIWLWVMEEYGNVDSWTRTTIGKMGPQLQGCTLDGRIMFRGRLNYSGRRIHLCHMETLEEQKFWVPDFQSVHTFKETLISPGTNVLF